MDLIEDDHPCYAGRFGPIGQRHANFIIQNADLIIALGSSMSLSTVGFNWGQFAPNAKKVMVNVDAQEMRKAKPAPDVAIEADVGEFMRALLMSHSVTWANKFDAWWDACREWRQEYPCISSDYFVDTQHVNSYVFVDRLSTHLVPTDIIVTGNSLDAWSVYQAFSVKRGQRIFTNINYGAMGWDLPAAIGASLSRERSRTVLITGDGSIQLNIQELQTIRHHSLNVKIFVLNNRGYASIRATQQGHFGGHLVGSDQQSGVSMPQLVDLAQTYGLAYSYIGTNDQISNRVSEVLAFAGPALCEVNVSYSQGRTPRVMSRRREDGSMESGTLQNMFPFLPSEEVTKKMSRFS
jgi:acetolactate synthase-1/2/3 large subunit